MYNKIAIYKWRETHAGEYKESYTKANIKRRTENIEAYRERDKLHKRFMAEVKRFRAIDLF